MAQNPVCDFGWKAPDFRLPGTDGKFHTLKGVAGPRGVVVAFICNHCPYVIAVLDAIERDARDLAGRGIGFVAICSNDAVAYPDDSFANMQKLAQRRGFEFPYLHDADQAVARAYDAACTPDFFGLNAGGELQYRGQIDATRPRNPAPAGTRRDLFDAMVQVAETGQGPRDQIASMGCSIKWIAA